VPLFPTQNELFHFMKDSIATGVLRPCAHLKYYQHVPRGLTGPRGYAPLCDRDSFKTEELRTGYDAARGLFDFYGCPPDCLLYEEDRRPPAPWRKETTQEAPMSTEHEGEGSQLRRRQPTAVLVAWIGFAGLVLTALIGAYAKFGTGKAETPVVNAPTQSAQRVETQQSQSVQNSPGSTNIQAGVVIQSSPSGIVRAPITHMVVETRFTTTPKTGVKLPPVEVPILGHFGAHAGLEGPAGRVRLDLANLIRYRQQDDGSLVVINRFALSPSSDLYQRPIEALGNYRTLDVSLNTPDFEQGISTVRLVEVTMTVNGQDVWHGALTPGVSFNKGQRFELPLDKLKAQLAGTK